ncbi:MAG TPA: class I SAM-dependent methyltransferase [Nitrospirae bacterium]|nr:class I SAM-dependent methyltransferase [Nitrospirota bacterium]
MNNAFINIKKVNCDLCGGQKADLLYKMPDLRYWTSEQEYSVVQCQNCGHRHLNPRPVPEDIRKCYPEHYHNFRSQDISKQQERYARQSSYFGKLPPGRFLDIGCAKGAFCETMMESGWDCYGMDLFDQPVHELPKDLKFKSGDIREADYPDNYFDGISSWGVFEHLTSPKRYFMEVERILKPNGLFVIMVPNGNSLWSRYAYKDDIPRHLQFFTPDSINKYAEISNLKIVDIDYTNRIYSMPATGRDCFRISFLKWAGVPWSKINEPQTKLHLKILSYFGSAMGSLLIHPSIEEILKLSGIMVVKFTKD